jgi:hypothetical protein
VDYAFAVQNSQLAARGTSPPAVATSGKSVRAKNQKRATHKVVARSARRQNGKDAPWDKTLDAEPSPTPPDARTAAWATFCQALFDSAEFRYLK